MVVYVWTAGRETLMFIKWSSCVCVCVCVEKGAAVGRQGGQSTAEWNLKLGRRKKEGRQRDLLSHLSGCTLYCPFSICSSTAAVTLHLRGQRVCEERAITAVKVAWHPPITAPPSQHRLFKTRALELHLCWTWQNACDVVPLCVLTIKKSLSNQSSSKNIVFLSADIWKGKLQTTQSFTLIFVIF